MKIISLSALMLGMVLANTAFASERLSDADFVKANRCLGIAARIGGGSEIVQMNALAKAGARDRAADVQARAKDEYAQGKRDASVAAQRGVLSVELSGPCHALGASPASQQTASR